MEQIIAKLNLDALYLVIFLITIMSTYSIGFNKMINSWFMVIINGLISYFFCNIIASYITFIPRIPNLGIKTIDSFLKDHYYQMIAFIFVFGLFYLLIRLIRELLSKKSKLTIMTNHLLAILVGCVLFVGIVYSSAILIESSKNQQLINLKKESQVITYLEKYNYFKPSIFI